MNSYTIGIVGDKNVKNNLNLHTKLQLCEEDNYSYRDFNTNKGPYSFRFYNIDHDDVAMLNNHFAFIIVYDNNDVNSCSLATVWLHYCKMVSLNIVSCGMNDALESNVLIDFVDLHATSYFDEMHIDEMFRHLVKTVLGDDVYIVYDIRNKNICDIKYDRTQCKKLDILDGMDDKYNNDECNNEYNNDAYDGYNYKSNRYNKYGRYGRYDTNYSDNTVCASDFSIKSRKILTAKRQLGVYSNESIIKMAEQSQLSNDKYNYVPSYDYNADGYECLEA